jgi:hypothetical protein
MAHIHVLLLCCLIGMASVDLCFDSLVLFDHKNCPISNIHQVQTYNRRTRATYIVHVITSMIGLLAISLIRCVLFRRTIKDFLSFGFFLTLLPYYLFIMEPAEDSCLGIHAKKLSEAELRDGLFKVGVGHVLIIVIGTIIGLLEVEWETDSKKDTKTLKKSL